MRGGAGASGGAAEVSEALASGGPEVRGAGAGVRVETARVCLRGRAGARGWADVRGGAGVSRGAAMRLPLVSWLPSLGSGC